MFTHNINSEFLRLIITIRIQNKNGLIPVGVGILDKNLHIWDIGGTKEKKRKILGKRVPLWVVLLLMVALLAVSITYAVTANQRTFTTLFGEVIDVTTEVSITELMIDIAKQSQSAVGDTPATAVTMTSGNPTAQTTITKPNWLYQVELECITGTTPASTTFKVDLYINSTLSNTLYVASDADPATGEQATCKFDIGADLSNTASYMMVVTEV